MLSRKEIPNFLETMENIFVHGQKVYITSDKSLYVKVSEEDTIENIDLDLICNNAKVYNSLSDEPVFDNTVTIKAVSYGGLFVISNKTGKELNIYGFEEVESQGNLGKAMDTLFSAFEELKEKQSQKGTPNEENLKDEDESGKVSAFGLAEKFLSGEVTEGKTDNGIRAVHLSNLRFLLISTNGSDYRNVDFAVLDDKLISMDGLGIEIVSADRFKVVKAKSQKDYVELSKNNKTYSLPQPISSDELSDLFVEDEETEVYAVIFCGALSVGYYQVDELDLGADNFVFRTEKEAEQWIEFLKGCYQ